MVCMVNSTAVDMNEISSINEKINKTLKSTTYNSTCQAMDSVKSEYEVVRIKINIST